MPKVNKKKKRSPRTGMKKTAGRPTPTKRRSTFSTLQERKRDAKVAAARDKAERQQAVDTIRRIHRLGGRPIEQSGLEDVREMLRDLGHQVEERPPGDLSPEEQDRQEAVDVMKQAHPPGGQPRKPVAGKTRAPRRTRT